MQGVEGFGGPQALRTYNRDRVIATLRALGSASQAEIARRTGLSRSTVSAIVAELRASGIVIEPGGQDGAPRPRGRPATLLALDPSAGVAAGVDFGKRHLAAVISDLSHSVIGERWQELPDDYPASEAMDAAAELVQELLEEAGVAHERVLGVGMGLPGPIHRPSGTLGSSTILPGWVGVRLAEEMEQRLEMPLLLENDANLGALAELMWGAGAGCENIAYLKVATGIGAGLIIGGRLYEGSGGTAGEIGHMTFDENGDICRCGNRGCLETVAAAPAIVRLLRRSLDEDLDADDVVERAVAGDAGCDRALADAGRHIGVAVANLCNLINPERIVVGGSIGNAGDVLLEPMRESVRLRAIRSVADDVEIVPGELKERAELLGTLALVLHQADAVTPTPMTRTGAA